jgi:hypothetical protein
LSRLDSFLRRLQAQRDCLDHAVALTGGLPGPVFEVGLGNGRTYDHLRESCPGREIFVFERKVCAYPDCVPDAEHLFEGPVDATLAAARARFAGRVALAHADLGSGHPDVDARTAATISAALPPLMARSGIIVSDQELSFPAAEALPLPPGVQAGRYFLYRCAG